jgi:hypothetical protein
MNCDEFFEKYGNEINRRQRKEEITKKSQSGKLDKGYLDTSWVEAREIQYRDIPHDIYLEHNFYCSSDPDGVSCWVWESPDKPELKELKEKGALYGNWVQWQTDFEDLIDTLSEESAKRTGRDVLRIVDKTFTDFFEKDAEMETKQPIDKGIIKKCSLKF